MPCSQDTETSTRGHRATHRATSWCPVPVACRPGPAACRRSEGAGGHAGQRTDTGCFFIFSKTNCFSAERSIIRKKQIKAAAARLMKYIVTYFQIRYRCQAWMWMLRAMPCNYRSELPRGLRQAAAACRGPAVHPTAANPKRQHFSFFFFFLVKIYFLLFKDANEFCPLQPRSWFEAARSAGAGEHGPHATSRTGKRGASPVASRRVLPPAELRNESSHAAPTHAPGRGGGALLPLLRCIRCHQQHREQLCLSPLLLPPPRATLLLPRRGGTRACCPRSTRWPRERAGRRGAVVGQGRGQSCGHPPVPSSSHGLTGSRRRNKTDNE